MVIDDTQQVLKYTGSRHTCVLLTLFTDYLLVVETSSSLSYFSIWKMFNSLLLLGYPNKKCKKFGEQNLGPSVWKIDIWYSASKGMLCKRWIDLWSMASDNIDFSALIVIDDCQYNNTLSFSMSFDLNFNLRIFHFAIIFRSVEKLKG